MCCSHLALLHSPSMPVDWMNGDRAHDTQSGEQLIEPVPCSPTTLDEASSALTSKGPHWKSPSPRGPAAKAVATTRSCTGQAEAWLTHEHPTSSCLQVHSSDSSTPQVLACKHTASRGLHDCRCSLVVVQSGVEQVKVREPHTRVHLDLGSSCRLHEVVQSRW